MQWESVVCASCGYISTSSSTPRHLIDALADCSSISDFIGAPTTSTGKPLVDRGSDYQQNPVGYQLLPYSSFDQLQIGECPNKNHKVVDQGSDYQPNPVDYQTLVRTRRGSDRGNAQTRRRTSPAWNVLCQDVVHRSLQRQQYWPYTSRT